jgi:hypothetical protein
MCDLATDIDIRLAICGIVTTRGACFAVTSRAGGDHKK